jgi:hypothetical protein
VGATCLGWHGRGFAQALADVCVLLPLSPLSFRAVTSVVGQGTRRLVAGQTLATAVETAPRRSNRIPMLLEATLPGWHGSGAVRVRAILLVLLRNMYLAPSSGGCSSTKSAL